MYLVKNLGFNFVIQKIRINMTDLAYNGLLKIPVYKFIVDIEIPKDFFPYSSGQCFAFHFRRRNRMLASGYGVCIRALLMECGFNIDEERLPFVNIINKTKLQVSVYENPSTGAIMESRNFHRSWRGSVPLMAKNSRANYRIPRKDLNIMKRNFKDFLDNKFPKYDGTGL